MEINLNNYYEVLDVLFEAMPFVFWKDRGGIYLGGNNHQAYAFGFNSPADFIGKTIFEIIEDKKAAVAIDDIDNKIMHSGEASIIEETISTPFGVKTYLSQKNPVKDSNDNVIGLLGFSMDVTELKKYEILAKQQEKFKTTLGQMVHDIKSPLSSLSTIFEEQSNLLPENTRITLRNAKERISDITNNLFNEYENKDIKNENTTLLVSLALLQIIGEKRYEYSKKSITFESDIEKEANFAFIKINPSDFKRMISNIVNNAVEALDGIIDAKVRFELGVTQDNVVLFIRDNGLGMPKHIIEKFYAGIAVTEGKENGHGIGLTTVRDVIAAHGGECKIRTIEGRETRFVIKFPLVATPHYLAIEIKLTVDDTIVILDDDESIHGGWDEKFKPLLEQFPTLIIKHFTYGQDAINYINSLNREQKQNVFLLTDYELLNQGMNGLDVIKNTDMQRAILVTSHASSLKVQENVLQAGVKTLPKELVHIVPIHVDKKIPKWSKIVDMVWIEDQKCFVDDMVREFYSDIKVDVYYDPESLLADVHQYPLDTKFILDTYYFAEDGTAYIMDGFDVAKKLHEIGYTKLILFAGEAVKAENIPPYLTVVLKNDPRRKSLNKV